MSDPQSVDLPLVDLTIGIRAELSLADPDTCKFTVSRSLHPGGPFFFGNKERAAGSPLGERLFALPGVANVLIAECVVTIGKEPSASWSGLKSAIGTAIRTQLLTGVPAILKMAVGASTQERSTPSFRRPFRNSWTGKSIVPSLTTAGRFRSWTSARGSFSSP